MLAWVLTAVGDAPELTEIVDPTPATDEVLVRVTASSVNPHDAMVASGAAARYLTYDLPAVLGTDVAGTVVGVGSAVADLAPGDRVFGLVRELTVRRGTFAELVAVPREWLARTPDSVDDALAGTLGLAGLTALRCREAILPAAGETVLVNGATGGVGSFLTQMLAAQDVRVIATASGDAETTHAEKMGAAAVVDWRGVDVADGVRAIAPTGVTGIVDLVTRDADRLSGLADALLGAHGRLASTNHVARQSGSVPTATNIVATADATAIQTLASLAAEGALRRATSRALRLPALPEALAALAAGSIGKIGLSI